MTSGRRHRPGMDAGAHFLGVRAAHHRRRKARTHPRRPRSPLRYTRRRPVPERLHIGTRLAGDHRRAFANFFIGTTECTLARPAFLRARDDPAGGHVAVDRVRADDLVVREGHEVLVSTVDRESRDHHKPHHVSRQSPCPFLGRASANAAIFRSHWDARSGWFGVNRSESEGRLPEEPLAWQQDELMTRPVSSKNKVSATVVGSPGSA